MPLQRRDRGAGLGDQGLRPHHVELGAGAGLAARGDDPGLTADHLERAPRHGDLLAQGADLGVGAGGLGGDGDLEGVAGGRRGLGVGAGRLDRPADAAEQVQFVGDIDEVVESPDRLRLVAGDLEDLVGGRIAAVDRAGKGGGVGIAPRPGRFQHRARARQIGLRRMQVRVGGQGLAD